MGSRAGVSWATVSRVGSGRFGVVGRLAGRSVGWWRGGPSDFCSASLRAFFEVFALDLGP